MARTISVFIAGAVLLVAAACMMTARQQSLFFEGAGTTGAQVAAAEAAPV